MSTYYYMICPEDMTMVFFATSSQGGPLRIQEESSDWLKCHMFKNIELTTEHDTKLDMYEEIK